MVRGILNEIAELKPTEGTERDRLQRAGNRLARVATRSLGLILAFDLMDYGTQKFLIPDVAPVAARPLKAI